MRASGLPVLAMSLCVMGLSRLLVGCTCLGEWDAVGRRGNLGVPTQKDGKQALARRILMRVGSRMSHSRELLERPLHGRSSEERNACSEQAVMLSSTFVNKKYNEEQAILEEVDFLRRFGTQMSLDGDNQSPVGRKDSTALLRSLLQYLKPVWIIENQLYAMNHLLKLRRKYGVLDDVTLVFMTTFEFGFNQSTQVPTLPELMCAWHFAKLMCFVSVYILLLLHRYCWFCPYNALWSRRLCSPINTVPRATRGGRQLCGCQTKTLHIWMPLSSMSPCCRSDGSLWHSRCTTCQTGLEADCSNRNSCESALVDRLHPLKIGLR